MTTSSDLSDAVNAIFDEARDRVLSLLTATPTTTIVATATATAGTDPASGWEYVESREGVSYRWPQALETYDSFRVFRRTSSDGPILMAVATPPAAEFFGREREYRVIFLLGTGGGSQRPVVVFTECDDYQETHQFAAIVRGKGETGQEMFGPGEDLPAGYERLTIETFRHRISARGSYTKLAVIAGSDEEMLAHAALQVRTRGLKPAQA